MCSSRLIGGMRTTDPFGPTNCPLVTPFADGGGSGSDGSGDAGDGDGENGIDTASLASLVDALVERGLDGLVPCGTTGEFASLSDSEYRIVVETTVDAADGRAPVMAGAAATRVRETLARLDVAAEAGADAGLVTLPYFHGANAPDGDERFLRAVAAETPIPIYLYNIPMCVGRGLSPGTVGALADHEAIIGMKDTSGDFEYFLRVDRHTPDDFVLLQGYDSFFTSSLAAGAPGGINALTNAIPESFVAAVEAHEAGDHERAMAIQATEITPLFDLCLDYGFAPAAKVAAAARGFVSETAVRPPLVELGTDARADVEAVVTSVATNYE